MTGDESMSNLEIVCWKYCSLVESMFNLHTELGPGYGSLYGLDNLRGKHHEKLCKLTGLEASEFSHLTDHLDKLGFDGTKLFINLLDLARNKKMRLCK